VANTLEKNLMIGGDFTYPW